jgi:hypothetical protein
MAKAPKYHKLDKAQKEEIRRLTQQANRRIAAATKAYEKAGQLRAPKALTGGYDIREKWFSEKYAISRSVKFASEKEYLAQLEYLRQFDPSQKDKRADYAPSLTEYAEQERANTTAAIENILDVSVEEDLPDLAKKISRMTAPQITAFWKAFTRRAQKMGVHYSSVQAMEDTLREFFPEDMKIYNNMRAEDISILQYKNDMMNSKAGL